MTGAVERRFEGKDDSMTYQFARLRRERACVLVGKPDEGELHVWFDERERNIYFELGTSPGECRHERYFPPGGPFPRLSPQD